MIQKKGKRTSVHLPDPLDEHLLVDGAEGLLEGHPPDGRVAVVLVHALLETEDVDSAFRHLLEGVLESANDVGVSKARTAHTAHRAHDTTRHTYTRHTRHTPAMATNLLKFLVSSTMYSSGS